MCARNLVGETFISIVVELLRDPAFERTYGTSWVEKPRRVKPMSGTRMEQAWQVARGAKRREGEKP
jgi:hypothetical protein